MSHHPFAHLNNCISKNTPCLHRHNKYFCCKLLEVYTTEVVTIYCDRVLSGEQIKGLRERHELSQGQLAYLIGVRQQSVAKYEKRGVRNYWVVQRIAIALGIKLSEIWEP
jgi:DNA-binding XRE family transcriptional regulator